MTAFYDEIIKWAVEMKRGGIPFDWEHFVNLIKELKRQLAKEKALIYVYDKSRMEYILTTLKHIKAGDLFVYTNITGVPISNMNGTVGGKAIKDAKIVSYDPIKYAVEAKPATFKE